MRCGQLLLLLNSIRMGFHSSRLSHIIPIIPTGLASKFRHYLTVKDNSPFIGCPPVRITVSLCLYSQVFINKLMFISDLND